MIGEQILAFIDLIHEFGVFDLVKGFGERINKKMKDYLSLTK
jgi:hypothetical protein